MSDDLSTFKKQSWRRENLAWLERFSRLWEKPSEKKKSNSAFRFDYLEMIGASGREMYKLMADRLASPKQFIGIDTNTTVLMLHRMAEEPFEKVLGDVFEYALELLSAKNPRLGVINFDTMNGLRPTWWEQHRAALQKIVRLGVTVCPNFTLILNHSLDRGGIQGENTRDRLHTHAREIADTFSDWKVSASERLTEGYLLKGAESGWEYGFRGQAGPFRIYRSEDHSTRMVTVRLTFHTDRKILEFDRRFVREVT